MISSKNVNIESGNIEFSIDLFNIDSKNGVKTGSPWGGGWGGPLLMMIGDAMTPFDPTGGPVWPCFSVDVTVFEIKFDVTIPMVSI